MPIDLSQYSGGQPQATTGIFEQPPEQTQEQTQEYVQNADYRGPAAMPTFVKDRPQANDTGERVWNATGGALEFGSADAGSALFRAIGGWTGSNNLTELGNELEIFKNEHPEYAPKEVDNTWNLLTDPEAMSSRVFGMAPMLAITAGTMAIPYAGPPLAAGLVYAIESQRAYDQAKVDGATEEEARNSAIASGIINGGLQLLQTGNIKNFLGLRADIGAQTTDNVVRVVKKLGFKGEAVKFLATQGLYGALGTLSSEGIPALTYGKPIAPGIFDRFLQASVGNTAAAVVFGIPMEMGLRAMKGAQPNPGAFSPEATRLIKGLGQIASSQHMYDFLLNEGLNAELAKHTTIAYSEQLATYATEKGTTKEQAWLDLGLQNNSNFPKGPKSLYFQDVTPDYMAAAVEMKSKLQGVLADKKFASVVGKSGAEIGIVYRFLRAQGVKDEELNAFGLGFLGDESNWKDKVTKEQINNEIEQTHFEMQEIVKTHQFPAEEERALADQTQQVTTELDKLYNQFESVLYNGSTPENADIPTLLAVRNISVSSLFVHETHESYRQALIRDYNVSPNVDPKVTERIFTKGKEISNRVSDLLIQADVLESKRIELAKRNKLNETRYGDYSLETWLLEQPDVKNVKYTETVLRRSANWAKPDSLVDMHWIGFTNETHISGVVAHARTTTIEFADGRKVLLVEELQSTAHQDRVSSPDLTERYPGGKTDPTTIPSDLLELYKSLPPEEQKSFLADKSRFSSRPWEPYQKTWKDYVFKKMIQRAVEEGQYEIWITGGDEQLRRYAGMPEENAAGLKVAYDTINPRTLQSIAQKYDKSVIVEPVEYQGKKFSKMTITKKLRETVIEQGLTLFQEHPAGRMIQGQFKAALKLENGKYLIGDTLDHDILRDKAALTEDQTTERFLAQKIAPGQIAVVKLADAPTAKATTENPVEVLPKLRKSTPRTIVTPDQVYYMKDETVFPGARGVTAFMADGRVFMKLLQGNDPTTTIHEFGHMLLEKGLISPDKLKRLETEFGVKDGVWTTTQKERFSDMLVRYFHQGRAPSANLVETFKYFKKVMAKHYKNAKEAGASDTNKSIRITREMRAIFDSLYVPDTDPITQKRVAIRQLEDKPYAFQHVEVPTNQSDDVVQAALEHNAAADLEIAQRKQELKRLDNELRAQQMLQYNPRVKTYLEEQAERTDLLPEQFNKANPNEFAIVRSIKEVRDVLGSTFMSMAEPLMRTAHGKLIVEHYANAVAWAKSYLGQFANEHDHIIENLGKSGDELTKIGHTVGNAGFSNLSLFMNETTNLPAFHTTNEALNDYKSFYRKFFNKSGQLFEKLGVMRYLGKSADGTPKVVPAKAQDLLRFPRSMKNDVYMAIVNGGGPLYEALARGIKDANPDLETMPHAVVKTILQRQIGLLPDRKVGMVEGTRFIKNMPDYIKFNGQWRPIMEMDPSLAIWHTMRKTVDRLGQIREFGQGMLADQTEAHNQLKRYQELALNVFGIDPQVGREALMQELTASGALSISELQKAQDAKWPELLKIVRAHEISAFSATNAFRDAINQVDVTRLSKEGLAALKEQARRVGGISTKLQPAQLIQEIQYRLDRPVYDLMTKLADGHVAEGGKIGDINSVQRVMQGLPYHELGTDIVSRMGKFVSQMIGSFQTSLSVVPNIPQTALVVPHDVGILNYLTAVKNVLTNRNMTENQLASMGAVFRVLHSWRIERGYWLEGIGRNVGTVVSKVSGMESLAHMNNLFAGEAYRLFAEGIRNHGAKAGDLVVLKESSRLNPKELAEVQAGKMSDETFQKIVQNGISHSQFVTEDPYMRSKIENIPLAKMIFAYSNYAMGQTRVAAGLAGEVKTMLGKNAGIGDRLGLAKRLAVVLASAYGVGQLSGMLRSVVNGKVDPISENPKEEFWDNAWKSIAEVQFFGAANRMLGPFQYDNGIIEKAGIGMAPQATLILRMIGALVGGYGKYGMFPMKERVGKLLLENTPIARATGSWIDYSAFPEQATTRDLAADSRRFEKNVLGQSGVVMESKIRPEYDRIFQRAMRLDEEGVLQYAKEYYDEAMKNVRTQQDFNAVKNKLRTSLMARGPLSMNLNDRVRYFLQLPVEKRDRYFQTYLKYQRLVDMVAPGRQ